VIWRWVFATEAPAIGGKKGGWVMGYIGFAIIVIKIAIPMGIIWAITPQRLKNKFMKWVNGF
jgi:hypothetical protein